MTERLYGGKTFAELRRLNVGWWHSDRDFGASYVVRDLLDRIAELEARLGREMDVATQLARLCVCKDNDTDAAKRRADKLYVENAHRVQVMQRMVDALDHQALRGLFGDIEGSDTKEADKLWLRCQDWFCYRDEAMASYRAMVKYLEALNAE